MLIEQEEGERSAAAEDELIEITHGDDGTSVRFDSVTLFELTAPLLIAGMICYVVYRRSLTES